MRILAIAAATVAAMLGQGPQKEPLRLKAGDTLSVTSDYGGEFQIMADGAIYGRGFGRLMVEGKTWDQAQTALRSALRKYVREDEVHLAIKELRRDVVYLVGIGGGKGAVELLPGFSLRQLLATAPLDGNTDQVQAQIFRRGSKVFECNVAGFLAGSSTSADQKLEPDDVVALVPTPFMRIWVTGYVARPGQYRVPSDTDVHRAVAEAGGLKWPELSADQNLQKEAKIVVHRGPETFDLPLRDSLNGHSFSLESGDTVAVSPPDEHRVTVAGEVEKPGEYVLRGERALHAALALAGGLTAEGTQSGVLIMRKGELYRIDATAPEKGKTFLLETGDLVYAQRNERVFLVLGEVNRPGKVLMKDGKSYRLSDALAEANGLNGKGTLRRVYLSRPDATGKAAIRQFNLDEYMKDGKLEANPEIRPGDAILFGQPRGISTGSITQILSGALMFEAVAGGR